MGVMAANRPGADDAEQMKISTAVLGLVVAAMADRLDLALDAAPGRDLARESSSMSITRRRMLLRRIYEYIEQRLGDPGLSPGSIAAAHHISTRYLHKLFETEGCTVAAWIRRRRLDRCSRDLADPAQWNRPVNAIAVRWGFADDAHFNRLFRATYGVPPGRYRTMRLGLATSS
jgi:AraC-like DNA-binding protein